MASKTVTVTPVVIWYAATPEGVEARVRTYAGDVAVLEQSHMLSDAELTAHAVKRRKETWDERDICALVPHDNATWGGTRAATKLRQDIIDKPRG